MTAPEDDVPSVVEGVFREALERKGRISGEVLHDEIADPAHPLHGRYEWDDAVAGRKHRISQIDADIRRVHIKFWVEGEDEPRKVRAFTAVRYTANSERLRGYVSTDDVVRDPLSAKALEREYRRWLKQGQERFANLQAYVDLMQNGERETG